MWKNIEPRQATDDSIVRRMRFPCRMTKATDIYLICLILIGFPRQQWLREPASVLRYTCIVVFRSVSDYVVTNVTTDFVVIVFTMVAVNANTPKVFRPADIS